VSTNVGGVPEVLPPHMIKFAQPSSDDVVRAIEEAIPLVPSVDPFEMHRQVSSMYDWRDVAARTEIVYDKIAATPSLPLIGKLQRYYATGSWLGKLYVMSMMLCYCYWQFVEVRQA